MSIILSLLRPFLVYIVGAALLALGATGLYFKIKHDGAVSALQKVEQEKQNAVKKVRKYQDGFRNICDINPARCVPDDWYRD